MNRLLVIAELCLFFVVATSARQKTPPTFPQAFYTEVTQCQVTGPDSCEYYVVKLYYDYIGQRAKVDYVYKVDQDDQTEGTLLFRWDVEVPMAYNIQYSDNKKRAGDDDCECIDHPLSDQEMPILRVAPEAVYGGRSMLDDSDVDYYWYNKTGFSLEYFVSVSEDEEDDPILPISSVQIGELYGDFYCNFTDAKVKQPKQREFDIPDCCLSARRVNLATFHKRVFPSNRQTPIRLALGCLTPPKNTNNVVFDQKFKPQKNDAQIQNQNE